MIAAKNLIRTPVFLATMLLAGSLWAADRVALTTPVSGVVKEVYVQVGQKVKKGDKLLALDDTRLQARLMEAEAGVMRAAQEAEDADKEFKRAEDLYARGVSSTTEFDASKLRHVRAAAALKEAEAHRIIAQKNLDDSVLKAPFDGVVKVRGAEPGMFVSVELNPPALIVLGKLR
jgi:RND family efflux transporter MFP subunit